MSKKRREANKLALPNVTLVALACKDVWATVKAMQYSMKEIDFGDSILITHKKPFFLPSTIKYSHTDKNKSIDDFNYKMVFKLYQYIKTDFALLVHADGFVVNPQMWRKEFLEYDYIGAPWPLPKDDSFRDIHGNLCRVGNSVSIRSKRLLELPAKIGMEWHGQSAQDGIELFNEDGYICCAKRHVFEQYGMKYAPIEVAKYFSHETMIPEIEGIVPFAFHKWAGTNAKYPDFRKKLSFEKLMRGSKRE